MEHSSDAGTDRGQPEANSRVSARVQKIQPQQIRVMFELASAVESEADGDADLVHLEFGEPDFETPENVVAAAFEAAREGETKYTSNAGLPVLREAIAERCSAGRDRPVDPDSEVIVTNGGVEALHLAIHTVANLGDEVVIPTPAWPNPISQAKLADAVPVEVPMPAETGFEPDPDRIIDAIGPETAAVMLTSPSNPTGRVFSEPAIERVIEAAVSHEAYVIADEVYRELTYEESPPRAVALTDHDEWVLSVNSTSKTYAMTGWRVGWLTGPDDVVTEMTKIHESTTSCVNTPAQYAALEALTGPQEPFEKMHAAFRERREFVISRLESIPHISVADPEGAFYAFVDVSALSGSSTEIAKRLLYDYGVVAAPGAAFGAGGEGHLRLSFANDHTRLELGLDRLETMVRDELGEKRE
ncbi:aminotransferase class I/II-fold pyridoxal phosphate-dependent enzyme [Natronolimnobius sp. AArcel1]|uniref:pyridoxal phosphate-dependent aminotransferase n=1 Tax=Natronolimnobius sp. AArcel1 TaxID=1679093 RepID=UPI0013EAFB50|nr:aminotransferase class I/II-fold pyridoxal phosphate-dependent enzyme [Natronolimnobius sp. AArcel1]NGM67418.1 aminotransferase class I/II-fold pyridoxal phosphate-dependent enzyme [Natronolimnobius sp. AArcel1]